MNITKERLDELEKIERKLSALEIGGVDSWTYYGEAMDSFFKEERIDEEINKIIFDLSEILLESKYEPSERGAGWSFTEQAHQDAYTELKERILELTK